MEEKDPLGVQQHDPGAKLDEGKVLAGILCDFGLALLEVSKVGTFGAKKYSRGGWQSVQNGQLRYTDALFRHLLIERYEDIDPDSEICHAAHLAWNALARLELKMRENLPRRLKEKDLDSDGLDENERYIAMDMDEPDNVQEYLLEELPEPLGRDIYREARPK